MLITLTVKKNNAPLTMRYHGVNIALYRAIGKRKIDRSWLAGRSLMGKGG
jgi:hypothetical protein